jgi:BirA family biotin operon repressor/biotin-[acetyl-CoA-carboxylase] ligase
MKAPRLENCLILDEVGSTQDAAKKLLEEGSDVSIVMAHNQVTGRGRLGRQWVSKPYDSLTTSFIFHDYADHPRPYLVGMALAIAVAAATHSELRWPNDVIFGLRKAGGILTELFTNSAGKKVPVVGIGINMNQTEFPEPIQEIATSLALEHGRPYSADALVRLILEGIERLPEPKTWADLRPAWDLFDRTPGKLYRLPSGEMAVGLGIGSEGQLLCSVDGESRTVLAAEALFGEKES